MADIAPCNGCGNATSYLVAAQFRNNDEEKIICKECWRERDIRCFFGPNGLVVSKECPPDHKKATLYWDEGWRVTDGEEEIHYPSTKQP